MKVNKVHLADLELVYAVTAMELEGDIYCLAASEKRDGACLCIHLETGKSYTVWDGPGGVMTLLPLEGENAFLSIDEFYPVFDSAAAAVFRTEISVSDGEVSVKKEKLCDLPFVHRIGLLEADGQKYLVGASLCSGKDYVDDWSRPGGIYAGEYHPGSPVAMKNIYMGLTKNHGMFLQKNHDGSQTMFIGASEGVLRVEKPEAGEWKTELIPLGETSDVWTEDFDGDGKAEIATIQGFHGEHIRIFKEGKEKQDIIGELPIHFGHVLWAGRFFGALWMIGGSRGEDKALVLYKVKEGTHPEFEKTVLDEGTGATQISVVTEPDRVRILASNHGKGSVDMYVLERE
ncbi:MAG: hypothetical protein LUI07_03535 [Lachnospiraceae bacterium]|nr:hypothetical protein [Lachnospiraceae bacterium]